MLHLLVSQIPTAGYKEVRGEYTIKQDFGAELTHPPLGLPGKWAYLDLTLSNHSSICHYSL
jgi:hypothetical protein